MDYEKKYKDALSHAKQAYGTGAYDDSTLEAIFPELAENEDERIRKELISQVEKSRHHPADKARWISWIEKQKDLDNMIVVSPEVWDNAIADAYENGKKDGEKQKEQHPSSRFHPADWVVYNGPLGHAILQIKDVVDGRYTFVDNESTLLVEDSDKFLRPLTPKDVEKPAEWKPQPESLEALMYAIEGKWDAISPTSYLSRRLEDLYEGLVNTYNVDESLLAELPKAASRAYTADDIEELRELKRKIEASMEQKPAELSEVELEFRGEKVKVKRPFFRDDKGRGYSTTEQDEEVAWNALRAWCEKKDISLYDLYPREEWSEEDADILNCCISSIEEAKENRYAYKETDGDTSYDREIDWLKSLRPSWKPSEEQMSMLLAVINDPNNAGAESCYMALKSIYNNLKKL